MVVYPVLLGGMVFKKITLIGRSNESFEDAVNDAIDRADQTLQNLMWVSVENQAVELNRAEREYQAEAEVAFEPDEGVGELAPVPFLYRLAPVVTADSTRVGPQYS